MASIAASTALLAAALAPPALALTSSGTGTECYRLPGSASAGVTASGQPCSLIEGSSGGSSANPTRFAKGEVIHVSGSLPPSPAPPPFTPNCSSLTCLPSAGAGGRGGLSLERDEGSRRGSRGTTGASPAGKRSRKEEERLRARECREIWDQFQGWEGVLIYWNHIVAQIVARGYTLSTLPDSEKNEDFWTAKRAYDKVKVKIGIGFVDSEIKRYKERCGPPPLKWRLFDKY
jgi:hypothetical protein